MRDGVFLLWDSERYLCISINEGFWEGVARIMDVSWHSSDEEKNRIRIHIKSLKNALCQQHNKVEQLQQCNKELKKENKALREENENLKKTIDTLRCQMKHRLLNQRTGKNLLLNQRINHLQLRIYHHHVKIVRKILNGALGK